MKDLIEFKDNGFILTENDTFCAFQAVNYIEPIKIITDDDVYNEKLGICSIEEAKAKIKYTFIINLKDGKKISVGYYYSIPLYQKFTITNKFLRFLFGDFKYKLNKNLDRFYSSQTKEMKQDMSALRLIRNKLIEKFNNWKGN